MTDPIHNYLDACREFDEADATMNRLSKTVSQVAVELTQNRRKFMFSNISVGNGFPAEVAMAKGVRHPDANEWPSAHDIQSAAVKWHEARGAMLRAWSEVPQADQKRLNGPSG